MLVSNDAEKKYDKIQHPKTVDTVSKLVMKLQKIKIMIKKIKINKNTTKTYS